MSKLVMHRNCYPDSDDLGPRLRGIDKFEVRVTNDWAPAAAIRESIAKSTLYWTGTIDDQEEMVVGVAPLDHCPGWAAPWMLTTDRFIYSPGACRDFLRRTPAFVEECAKGFDVLFNLISEHNYASRRWLRYADFKIKLNPPQIIKGYRFLEFIRVTPGGTYWE